MVVTLFGPLAAFVGVPIAARYAGRGFVCAGVCGGIACLLFSFVALCAIPVEDVPGLALHIDYPKCFFAVAAYVAWTVPWAIWAGWCLRRARERGGKDEIAVA